MKNCPVCGVLLVAEAYEGFGVLRCGKCYGHLVDTGRLESIRRVNLKSRDELQAEASSEFNGSIVDRVQCPKCRLPMRKQTVKLPGFSLELDVCGQCSLIWLDGGELAVVQLGYEATPGFADAQELKRRMAEVEASPERKAALEEKIARLRDAPDPVAAGLSEVAVDLLGSILRSRRQSYF